MNDDKASAGFEPRSTILQIVALTIMPFLNFCNYKNEVLKSKRHSLYLQPVCAKNIL